jgi:23S rRNA (adenine1618-N6)-methyltransferase
MGRTGPYGIVIFVFPCQSITRQLTLSLAHRDFNLTLQLPDDRLCPPIPNRFNYILHLQRLIDTTSPTYNDLNDPNRQIIGIDIGTGASAIYPLLACRQRPGWRMLCTEIDEKSREYAKRNIKVNGLDNGIKLVDCDRSSKQIIPTESLQRFERYVLSS